MDAKVRGNDDDDHRCASGLSSIKKKLDRSVSDVCNSGKDGFIFGSWKCRRNSKKTTRVDANEDEYATVDYGSTAAAAAAQVRRRIKPRPSSVQDQLREQDFWCPRCGSKMEEPRLLPCLHSVCSACVDEFMSKHYYDDDEDDEDVDGHHYSRLQEQCGNRASGSSSLKSGRRQRLEGCPRCGHPLPRHGSSQQPPPPHYSLQHRLVIYAVRRRLSQRAICCDACPQEVQATQHCSRCLCNFCDECGALHREQHQENSIRPLWQAKRIRRLAVCLEHPAHSLRYHCLACKRATCKECMWTPAHRGHASEDAARAGARARLRLEAALREARGLLELLLLRETERQAAAAAALDFVPKDGWQRTKSPPERSTSTHSREARQRILEYSRLKRAKYLTEAIFIADDLLANGSVVEILSLERIILKRLRFLGLDVDDSDAPDGCSDRVKSATTTTSTTAMTMHSGIFHCCTFCSSGGKKDVACACGGTMPGGYRGCGHGHSGHPGERHWSCCGSTTRDGACLSPRRCTYKLII